MEFKQSSTKIIWLSLAGLSAIFIGVGLGRFGYTPMIPILINQHWLTKAGAGYLGAVNFFGYLLGALCAKQLSQKFRLQFILKYSLIFSTLSLLMCALNWGIWWLSFWRFLIGMTGAFLMVLCPAAILKNIPAEFHGRVSGLIFTGLGLGMVLSGFLFPYFAKEGAAVAWLGAGVIALVALVVAWPSYLTKQSSQSIDENNINPLKNTQQKYLNQLALVYGLFGVGIIPHTLFLVDYVHREVGLDLMLSGLFWSVFGFGSLIGSFLSGMLADKVGTHKSLVIALFGSCIGVAIIVFNHVIFLYLLSSFLMGILLPTIVSLTSTRTLELVGVARHAHYWGRFIIYFSVAQVLSGYFMSYLLHQGFSYTLCFVIAGIVYFIAFLILLV